MKQLECMYGWNPGTDQIAVGPWPDETRWSDKYQCTMGACWLPTYEWSQDQQEKMLFIDFHTIVVRDGVPVDAAHRAFLKIDEYRRLISPDTPGAEGAGVW